MSREKNPNIFLDYIIKKLLDLWSDVNLLNIIQTKLCYIWTKT